MHLSARHTVNGNKQAILEGGKPVRHGGPNSPAVVLKQGARVIRQSDDSLLISSKLAVIPSVQAIARSQPNAAVFGCQDGPDINTRQALFDRNRGDGHVVKTV